jgi:hypothetical protein
MQNTPTTNYIASHPKTITFTASAVSVSNLTINNAIAAFVDNAPFHSKL